MTEQEIESMAQAAMKRLVAFINRSAGQHLRAMEARADMGAACKKTP